MKKDIEIPEVKNVEIAVVKEYNEDFLQDAWYAYLFNNTQEIIEAILVVSKAEGELNGEKRNSSIFRHAFPSLAAGECIKVELLDEAIFDLHNTFMLTYFQGNKLYDKNFVFPAKSITDESLAKLAYAEKNGITASK
ncbi:MULTISPECIES: hypothetical protein [Myroides]|jgi:hypothetical protein|uniref:Phenylalanyl-tRNA synthetase subunit alpha n=1 Tax=Myroides odoratus TaxID=256 RepID=A0A9Q6Z6X5_MYROD|nr:hypothetical protein [Myroides odoratus]EHQ42645.1 hypothetical protein Myrod_1812 [Myroides odoratus DSM 2801]EKB07630.1 hypothetical protein HMPREF9716_01669 [Myroides odoratus CIP 103059]MDR0223634.1 hypothetical protein [Myroides odoratus]QQU00012.1 hypothetical protein I6I88_17900 [Myroides odoratus]WQD57772.1 hypothetical protein U0010_01050 [Myroides odoratus]